LEYILNALRGKLTINKGDTNKAIIRIRIGIDPIKNANIKMLSTIGVAMILDLTLIKPEPRRGNMKSIRLCHPFGVYKICFNL
jgi:hypothetical protein